MSTPAYMITNRSVSMEVDGRIEKMDADHPLFAEVLEAIRQEDYERARQVMRPAEYVRKQVERLSSNVTLSQEDNTLYYNGEPVHDSLAERILKMVGSGFDATPFVEFMENLYLNPSYRARHELYRFLEHNSLPLTPDGCFLAYKKVRENYKDIHSGKFDNSPGAVAEMDRTKVDDNPEHTCSAGLHFCSQDYLPHFGCSPDNRVVSVKINPRDVVSIPHDYDNAKGRCCRYVVQDDVTDSQLPEYFTSNGRDLDDEPLDTEFDREYEVDFGGYSFTQPTKLNDRGIEEDDDEDGEDPKDYFLSLRDGQNKKPTHPDSGYDSSSIHNLNGDVDQMVDAINYYVAEDGHANVQIVSGSIISVQKAERSIGKPSYVVIHRNLYGGSMLYLEPSEIVGIY